MSASPRPHITLLLGGVRSGKSARALALAESLMTPAANGPSALFVATAQAFDEEMTRKIAAHRAERSAKWSTLESPVEVPADLTSALAADPATHSVVVIDCVTLWVSNILLALDETANAETVVAERVRQLLAAFDHGRAAPAHFIVVSNEVGLGVVPPTSLGRRFRDALGRANQLLAERADEVILMVAGLALPLKPPATRGV